jgi:hypothetical protein
MTPMERACQVRFELSWSSPSWDDLGSHEKQIEIEAFIAALLAIATPEAIPDAAVEAAILAWSDDYGRDAVHADWKRMIVAALRVMAELPTTKKEP